MNIKFEDFTKIYKLSLHKKLPVSLKAFSNIEEFFRNAYVSTMLRSSVDYVFLIYVVVKKDILGQL